MRTTKEKMQSRHLEAFTFSLKAALSAVAGVVTYDLAHLPGTAWVAAVSAVVVTQPSLDSSLKASWLRVAANLAGAFCGMLLEMLIGQPVVAMAAGVLVVGLGCYALKQDDMLRPAFVAVVLVTLAGESGEWQASRNRVLGVIVGCLWAVVFGFLIDKLTEGLRTKGKEADKPAADE
jgi:uncharacterized membrane protein YgaE (UPF0421/DUF939 family)